MANFHGIQVYEILENGNMLSGIYTNNVKTGTHYYDIDNEIARKKTFDDKGVAGSYACRYSETVSQQSSLISCTLVIKKDAAEAVYEFVWADNSGTLFTGIGFKVGNNHIAVSYTNME